MSSNQPKLIEHANGAKEWLLNGKTHREDGPAVENTDGTKEWYLNGDLHREDGPAVELADGTKYWFLNGAEIDQLVYWVTAKERQMA